ncbi:MAG: hypothetical protein ABFS34_05965 [Gemmatimonadota bacterium]
MGVLTAAGESPPPFALYRISLGLPAATQTGFQRFEAPKQALVRRAEHRLALAERVWNRSPLDRLRVQVAKSDDRGSRGSMEFSGSAFLDAIHDENEFRPAQIFLRHQL